MKNAPAITPEWMRVSEAVAFSRLSKAKLYDLMNRGKIKNAAFRDRAKGEKKGTRLISIASLREFLESNASGGEAK